MNRKDYILFDLDGTLTDPKEGITKSVQHALEHFGIQTDDLDSLTPFIGPPLRDSFKRYYGFSDEQAWEGVQAYREYFSVRGWVQNKEYPGIKEMLEALKEAGRVLLVATSKPEEFAKKILDHFDMAEYFDFIGGANMDETRVRKGDVIRYVLEENQITELDKVVMIGDREHDIIGAKENSIDSIGVLYGYGDREELSVAGADWIVDTVEELGSLLDVLVESRK